MDADNHIMLERYFSGGMFSPINSPAERINNRSKHIKFIECFGQKIKNIHSNYLKKTPSPSEDARWP